MTTKVDIRRRRLLPDHQRVTRGSGPLFRDAIDCGVLRRAAAPGGTSGLPVSGVESVGH